MLPFSLPWAVFLLSSFGAVISFCVTHHKAPGLSGAGFGFRLAFAGQVSSFWWEGRPSLVFFAGF